MSTESVGQAELGYLLQGLTKHIKSVVPAKCHKNIESWMDNAELQLTPKNLGNIMQIGIMEYQSQIVLERFPFREFDPAIVMCAVMAWLQDHDSSRDDFDLTDPTVEIEAESDNVATMEISIDFIEPIYVVEDNEGEIIWNNKTYRISDYDTWVAERFNLETTKC